MKQLQTLKRADKVALLSSLIEGNPTPIMKRSQQNEAGAVYMILATRENQNGYLTNITLNREPIPDMSSSQFNEWQVSLSAKGAVIICILRPFKQ